MSRTTLRGPWHAMEDRRFLCRDQGPTSILVDMASHQSQKNYAKKSDALCDMDRGEK